MKPGSVIVDLAVERGGNVEGAKPGEVADVERREDRRPAQRGRAGSPANASSLYAKNLYAFLEILIDKKDKALAVNWDDEIVKATAARPATAPSSIRASSRRAPHRTRRRDSPMANRRPQGAGRTRAQRRPPRSPRQAARSRAAVSRDAAAGAALAAPALHRGDRRRRSIRSSSASRSSCSRSSSATTWCGR